MCVDYYGDLVAVFRAWALFAVWSSVGVLSTAAQWTHSQMVSGAGKSMRFHAKPIDAKFLNPWPPELESEFQQRAQRIIRLQTENQKAGVNTYFENEKRSYGYLMAHVLGGNQDQAIEYLQAEDHQHESWHRETAGIDYFACFTLKHQMRKYFYFGELLDSEYRKRMLEGGRRWTERDPLRRPHYAFDPTKTGWGPDAKNSWVDVRSTENLYLMRLTSVYLMAEETGNQETARQYKKQILDYTKTLYRVGIGEWDSENYHGHSVAPLCNLYDFAKDEQVKFAAKACLDFFAAAGALKYRCGAFNGPTKRDYNHAQPFGGSAANSLWVWFGDHPSGKTDDWESDEVHQITSAYRPPMAVVNLARKDFATPIEIFSAKPVYEATTHHLVTGLPEYAETQFIGKHVQMGSLTGGTSVDGGDVNGFKILVDDASFGAVALQAAPTADPFRPGSPMYGQGVVSAENRVAQLENLAIWLAKDGASPWLWVIPKHFSIESKKGVTFLDGGQAWVAIWPLGTSRFESDKTKTELLEQDKKSRFAGHQVLSSRGNAESFCGMAVEVGDVQSYASFSDFQTHVLAAEVDTSELDDGIARYRAADGKWLGFHWNDDPLDLGVWRNGVRRDLSRLALYESSVISSLWGSGVLEVNAGGAKFRCEVDESGLATFENQ